MRAPFFETQCSLVLFNQVNSPELLQLRPVPNVNFGILEAGLLTVGCRFCRASSVQVLKRRNATKSTNWNITDI